MNDFQLSDQQLRVLDAVDDGRNVLITGSAGTGKSTVLRAMKDKYGWKLPVSASTGIAAVNVGGATLHSWAGIGLGNRPADVIADEMKQRQTKALRRIKSAHRLAIDEISMIGGETFNLIDRVFRSVRERDEPFGGIQLILFGDFLQLPPVSKTVADKANLFAFQSTSWEAARIGVAQLLHIFRQEDREFATALNQIRVGEIGPEAKIILNARYKAVDDDPETEPVTVHTHNADVERINLDRLAKIEGKRFDFDSKDEGEPGPLAIIQKNCLAPEKLSLKVGAQVMLLKNEDVENGLVNGSIGKVVGFTKFGNEPVVRFKRRELVVTKHTWEISQDGYVVASREQYPLRLAWAITAHKSQGMTLSKIRVHLAGIFEDGQAYTALSRARTKEGLFIADGDRRAIRANPAAVKFYQEAASI